MVAMGVMVVVVTETDRQMRANGVRNVKLRANAPTQHANWPARQDRVRHSARRQHTSPPVRDSAICVRRHVWDRGSLTDVALLHALHTQVASQSLPMAPMRLLQTL